MTQRDVTWALVDVIGYEYRWPEAESEEVVYEFTHSLEVNSICADMLPPHVLTPVDKETLEDALAEYVARKGIAGVDADKIRAWLVQLPDHIAILERDPNPFS